MSAADLLKNALTEFNTQQKMAFADSDVYQLIQQRSDFYDQWLTTLWQEFGFAHRNDLCLLAVGGFGRKEMFPLSDLDILVLTDKEIDETTQVSLNALFTLLWDCKIQVGSSIRTVAQCIEIGKNEISVATNMLESRFLAGNVELFQQLQQQLYQSDFWAIHDFFAAKMQEKDERYARYHNTSYNLEPDLKHSPGGLRDLNLLSWIMLRHYGSGVSSLESLLAKGVLFADEYEELRHAQAVLFRMRFALHLQLKRYDNRLRFDRQLQLSELLGYQGSGNQPVEAMMRSFFQATQSISQLTQLLLSSFEQSELNPLQKTGEKQPLDAHFFVQQQTIFCENPSCFVQTPATILDLFYHLTQLPDCRVSTTTLRQLRLAVAQQPKPLSDYPTARQRFLQIFQQPNMVKRAIVPMHQLGVLAAYLPQWKGIEGLMQFDLFHIYTVDEHTIRVMLKLESFLDSATAELHPVCCELFPKIENRHLLYLAALMHDIAKGREGDHAEVGAVDTYHFAKQHHFSEEDATQMAWLVAEHLTMSITAQRRDIHDPNVVQAFAQIVEDPKNLAALTCLTVADICATNETLWNDWKRSLLAQLFQFTTQQLQIGKQKFLDYKQLGLNHRLQASEQLKLILSHQEWQKMQQFWKNCPHSYFSRNSAKQLEWHIQGYLKQPQLPLVLVSNQYARAATEIFVHSQDQPQLFGRIAHTLSQKKISIHNAQIITGDSGLIFDSFIVTETNGSQCDELRSMQIQQALLDVLSDPNPHFHPTKRPVKHQSFNRPTRVRFLAKHRQDQTAFELFTLDREGLLAQVSYIFYQLDLILVNAKITTTGERVEDFFAITTQDHKPLSDAQKELLKERLLVELG